jgi:hypothetical protein
MFLSPAVFQWPYDAQDRVFPPEVDYVNKAHDVWRHAQNRLAGESTALDRVDCIGALKRAIDIRLKAIRATYNFEILPSLRAKKQTLEKLQDYGIVRPAILKELIDVRNSLEHEHTEPPLADKCKFYIDICWYFLKSTDPLVDMAVSSLVYVDDPSDSSVQIEIEPRNDWALRVHGYVRSEFILLSGADGALELTEFSPTPPKAKNGYQRFVANGKPNEQGLLRIAREYFGAAGYWYEDHNAA